MEPRCIARPLHIELAEWAELTIVAPLSASSLARWSQGSADGLLASVSVGHGSSGHRSPGDEHGHVAPSRGARQLAAASKTFLGWSRCVPASGLLACDRVGDGRMADPLLIQLAAASVFSRGSVTPDANRDWLGLSVLVSAGPTQESH